MEKSAIEQIQLSASIPELILHLDEKKTHVPTMVTPNSFNVQSLEQYMKNRSSYRFAFQTKSIKDFIQYGEDFDMPGAGCFVDSSSMVAKTIFDLGTLEKPLHQQHKSLLVLDETAAFAKLLSVDGSRISQKQASDFIEDWAENVMVYAKDGDFMNSKLAAASVRDLTIETARAVNSKVDDYEASMSTMEKVEAKNKHLLPSEIYFKCVPYLHLEERTFVIRVSLITGGDVPQLTFRVIKLESIKEEIAEEFKDILVDGLKACKTKVYMGS